MLDKDRSRRTWNKSYMQTLTQSKITTNMINLNNEN